MNDNPIGVFDSGVGGLAVVAEIRKLLPCENIIFYADSANFPYGNKSMVELQRLASQAAEFLVDKGAKIIVVACNTASSAALASLRERYQVPFVGMVPAVKPASAATRVGKVGVMATEATVQAEVFDDLIYQFANGVTVFRRACPRLTDLIERGEVGSPEIRQLLHVYLDPMMAEGIDVLVLGCTHYPFLRPIIEEIVGIEVAIMDTSLPVAKQVERVIKDKGLATNREVSSEVRVYSSGDLSKFLQVAERLYREESGLLRGDT